MTRLPRSALVLALCAVLAVGCSSDGNTATTAVATTNGATTDAPASTATTTAPTAETVATTTTLPPTTTTTTVDPLAYAPVIEDRVCHQVSWSTEDPPANATCYWVTVPADWADPEGATVRLPVGVLAASGDDPQPDPIVAPGGGPGFPASHHYWWAETEYNRDRDVIIYDQRGTGIAEPSLNCPEVGAARIANFQRADSFDVELDAVVAAALECRQRLEADGVDMNDYDSIANAYDLDAIRRALGYEEWNIFGVSYGSRLALTAMRTTPDHIRSVVLDSVVDVTAGGLAAIAESSKRATEILIDACAADPDCDSRYPDLADKLEQVIERYNAEPIDVELDLDDGNGPQTYYVTGDDAASGLHLALYEATLIPLLPSLITDIAAGRTDVVPSMLSQGISRQTASAHAMEFSVDCADNAGVNGDDIAFQADPGPYKLIAAEPTCDRWPVEPTAPDYNEPVVSDIPALVLGGGFDPVTPDIGSKQVADRLPNATFAGFPSLSHRVTTAHPCADQIALAFLADPGTAPDLSCIASVPAVAFS